MENKHEFNFYKGLLITIIVTGVLIISYALASIPIYWGIKVPDYYTDMIFAISSLLYLPIIFIVTKKYKFDFLINLKISDFKLIILILIFVLPYSILTVPLRFPKEFFITISSSELVFLKLEAISINPKWIIHLIHSIILAPILEEILFRGIILKNFLKIYSPVSSILLSSFLFSIGHLRYNDILSLFVFGLLTGIIFYKTRSLLLVIIFHSLSNLIIKITHVSSSQINDSIIIHCIVILLIAITTSYMFLKYSAKRNLQIELKS